jgi:hypothetical protein
VGVVLQGMIFRDVIERLHGTEYDFLRGDEGYKYDWSKRQRCNRTVLAWRGSLASGLGRREFLLRRRLSPWKRRFQVLWESGGRRLGSLRGRRTGKQSDA